MRFLLDTDHISIMQHGSEPAHSRLSSRIRQGRPDDIACSVVSFHEQVNGAHAMINRGQRSADLVRGYQRLLRVLHYYPGMLVLPFDEAAAAKHAAISMSVRQVAAMDLRIAAIALSRNLVLVTRNSRDFGKVPGLITQDWTV